MNKRKALLLMSAFANSTLIFAVLVTSASALSVPEVTMKFEAYPYDVPPTYGVDPYTGKNITIEEGYHARNETIVFTIKNQPATNLYYNVRYRGHFSGGWTEVFSYTQNSPESPSNSPGYLIPQSNSGYTTISVPAFYPFVDGATIDFQVQALSWTYVDVWVLDHPMAPPPINEGGHYERRLTLGETSDWSPVQTMTFPLILPEVTLLSPHEEEYNASDVPLIFDADQSAVSFQYSLDREENVTIAGNTTLVGLANGLHSVTIYATNEAGRTGVSETAFFNVEVPRSFAADPFIVIFVILVVIAVAGLLLYRRKRQREAAKA